MFGMLKPKRKTSQQLQAEEEAKYKEAVDVLKRGDGGLSKDSYQRTVRQYKKKKSDLAAKEAAAKAATQLQFEKDNPKLIQSEQPATVGPAQQDQAMRQKMFLNLENRPKKEVVTRSPQEEAENEYLRKFEENNPGVAYRRDKVLAGFRANQGLNQPTQPNQNSTEEINRPRMEPQVTPYPLRLGPQQQFNAMQQQMYQTQPQPAQQQPQPEQPQPTQQQNQLQEQQPKQIEQIAPVKKTFIKRKNTEM